jgi:hypothetical protein
LLLEALTGVAEQSFFACVEPCDPGTFAERGAAVNSWFHASVAFDGAFAGRVSCTLPEALGLDLFDAFIGLAEPEQRTERLILDLLGEFSNMVCGAWLTRTAERRQFRLSRPDVQRVSEPPSTFGDADGARALLLNDQPLAVQLTFIPCRA